MPASMVVAPTLDTACCDGTAISAGAVAPGACDWLVYTWVACHRGLGTRTAQCSHRLPVLPDAAVKIPSALPVEPGSSVLFQGGLNGRDGMFSWGRNVFLRPIEYQCNSTANCVYWRNGILTTYDGVVWKGDARDPVPVARIVLRMFQHWATRALAPLSGGGMHLIHALSLSYTHHTMWMRRRYSPGVFSCTRTRRVCPRAEASVACASHQRAHGQIHCIGMKMAFCKLVNFAAAPPVVVVSKLGILHTIAVPFAAHNWSTFY
jgi:hypothetical protein